MNVWLRLVLFGTLIPFNRALLLFIAFDVCCHCQKTSKCIKSSWEQSKLFQSTSKLNVNCLFLSALVDDYCQKVCYQSVRKHWECLFFMGLQLTTLRPIAYCKISILFPIFQAFCSISALYYRFLTYSPSLRSVVEW